MQVNISEAKNCLSLLIKAAQAGEDVVIANRGEPVVRLVPARAPVGVRANRGSARTILDWLDSHSLPAYAGVPPRRLMPRSGWREAHRTNLPRRLFGDLADQMLGGPSRSPTPWPEPRKLTSV
jgi:prevent-host-death family protein